MTYRSSVKIGLFFLLAFACFAATSTFVQAANVRTPPRGSVERKDVLDTIRPLLEVRVGAPVEFVVSWLRIYQDWAFVAVNPQRPGGGAIDLAKPGHYVSEFQDGLHTYALLKRAYGRWNIVDYAIGPTDVFWIGNPLYDQFPRAFVNP